ncbi:MAG: UDP-N-acetylmuramoyl-L-alanine--D-glutamate ligase [bacterium]|nr:UDP-N-acetylmuramoyl-L-alanine--D-glutamate ligase [bacterium]
MDLKNKRVTVIGLGNSGLNAALLLRKVGARVSATDSRDTPEVRRAAAALKEKGIDAETGGHTKDLIKGRDLIVISPGVEDSSPAIIWANELKVPVIGEMELGFNYCPGRIIAITGTNGKSTVTSLIGEILKNAGFDTVVCGNIGNSLSGEIDKIKDGTWVVLEVSSFQLERIVDFKPHIALILNMEDDHRDRYRTLDEYFKEKLKIFSNQDERDMLVLNYDSENLRDIGKAARSRVLFYSKRCENRSLLFDPSTLDMRLKGLHNLENVLASVLVGILCGARRGSIMKTVKEFEGLRHRFETVGTIEGVEYVDDSKGTTVDSTRRALESCKRPVILIAGGKDKNSDYSAVRAMVKDRVKSLVLIGEAKAKIRAALGGLVDTREAKDMAAAVRTARDIASYGDIVLLSPMCSSFDMFRDYKERGDVFKEAVSQL